MASEHPALERGCTICIAGIIGLACSWCTKCAAPGLARLLLLHFIGWSIMIYLRNPVLLSCASSNLPRHRRLQHYHCCAG
eukprot:scaffold221067_cov19-Tisochrysis_lutea.AAC.1